MALLYLHIGTVKTGTTYLQKTFYENRDVFERYGVSYPFVFPAQLNLPRYANAQFLFDRSRDQEARSKMSSAITPAVLISEEGMFGSPEHLRHQAFEGLEKKLILYVRPTADLLSAWAAEMAQPYNVLQVDGAHSTANRLLSIEEAIEVLSSEYSSSISKFMDVVDEIGPENFIVRPFERRSLSNGDLLDDFLRCLNIDVRHVRLEPDFREAGLVNPTSDRKFCDTSRAVWRVLGCPKDLDTFNVELVSAVAQRCMSGDARPVVDTLSDSHIADLVERFSHFETFISETFLRGQPVFLERYPKCFGRERSPYRPISLREVELVTRLLLLQKSL